MSSNLAKNETPEVFALNQINVRAGDEIRVTGLNLNTGMKVQVGDRIVPLKVLGSGLATFAMPSLSETEKSGNQTPIHIVDQSEQVLHSQTLNLQDVSSSIPYLNIDPALLCSDVKFRDKDGKVVNGQRNCSDSYPECGDGIASPCRSTEAYPSVDLSDLTKAQGKLRRGTELAGVTGTLPDCSIDGDHDCVAIGPSFAAALSLGAEDKIVHAERVAGIIGRVEGTALLCASDGHESCLTHADFPSMLKLGAADKIQSGTTLGGVSGQFRVPSPGDVAEGILYGTNGNANVGSLKIPLANVVKTGSPVFGNPLSPQTPGYSPDFPAPSAVHNTATVNNVSGTMLSCSGDNQTSCLTNADYPSVTIGGVNPGLIKSGVVVAGIVGGYPSASFRLAGDTVTADLNNFSTQIKSNTAFEYFDSTGQRHAASGDNDLVPANVRSGVVLENISLTGVLPAQSILPPTAFDASYATSPSRVKLSWLLPSGTGVLLVSRVGAAVTFVPTPGQTYSAGAQGANTILYVGSATSFDDTSITPGTNVYYSLFSYDANSYYSTQASTALSSTTACADLQGGSWVLVPGDAVYGTSDFCMMKYEAKKLSNVAASQASLDPWVNIPQTVAHEACRTLGAKYHLISNNEWMTAATNIASVAANWSGGVVGTNFLSRGHSDNSPTTICPASTDENLAYVENNCTPMALGTNDPNQKRTHVLTNGQVVWDLAGNATEITSDTIADVNHKPFGSADTVPVASFREYPSINSDFTVLAANQLVPRNAEKSFWNDSWTSAKGIGAYFAGSPGGGGVLNRGGGYSNTINAGIFQLQMNSVGYNSNSGWGFRCTYRP